MSDGFNPASFTTARERTEAIADFLDGYTSDADDKKILAIFDAVDPDGKAKAEQLKKDLPALLYEVNKWNRIPQLVDDLSLSSLRTLHHILVADLTKAFPNINQATGKPTDKSELVDNAIKEAHTDRSDEREYLEKVTASLMYAAIDVYRAEHPTDVTGNYMKVEHLLSGYVSESDQRKVAELFEKASPATIMSWCYTIHSDHLENGLLESLEGNYAARVKRALKVALSKAPHPKVKFPQNIWEVASANILCQPTWNMLDDPGCNATFKDLIAEAAALQAKGYEWTVDHLKEIDDEDPIIERLIGEVNAHKTKAGAIRTLKESSESYKKVLTLQTKLESALNAKKADPEKIVRAQNELEAAIKVWEEKSTKLEGFGRFTVRAYFETVFFAPLRYGALFEDALDKQILLPFKGRIQEGYAKLKLAYQKVMIAVIKKLDYPQFSEFCYRMVPRQFIPALFEFFSNNKELDKELRAVLKEKLQYALDSDDIDEAMLIQVFNEAQNRTYDPSKGRINEDETFEVAIRRAAALYAGRIKIRLMDQEHGNGDTDLNLPPVRIPHDEYGHGYAYQGDIRGCPTCHIDKTKGEIDQHGGRLHQPKGTWAERLEFWHSKEACGACHRQQEHAHLLGVYSRYEDHLAKLKAWLGGGSGNPLAEMANIMWRIEIDCRRCHRAEGIVGPGFTLLGEAKTMLTLATSKLGLQPSTADIEEDEKPDADAKKEDDGATQPTQDAGSNAFDSLDAG